MSRNFGIHIFLDPHNNIFQDSQIPKQKKLENPIRKSKKLGTWGDPTPPHIFRKPMG
jgi:hypothetical protein